MIEHCELVIEYILHILLFQASGPLGVKGWTMCIGNLSLVLLYLVF